MGVVRCFERAIDAAGGWIEAEGFVDEVFGGYVGVEACFGELDRSRIACECNKHTCPFGMLSASCEGGFKEELENNTPQCLKTGQDEIQRVLLRI